MTAVAVRAIEQQRADAEFAWKHGGIPVAPDVAALELRRVYQQFGAVTPDAIVRVASEESSPLHAAFEWDDSEAAAKYRETQARYMLRQLVVTYRKPDGEPTRPTRYFVNLLSDADDPATSDEEELATTPKVYLPVNRVMDSAALRRRYVHQAYREAASWSQRYADIKEFARVFAAIETVGRDLGYGA